MASKSSASNGSVNGSEAASGDRHVRVAIIGSGFSGLGAAIRLKQEGIDDFVVFEQADDVGGTWQANTYPGVECDVPSNLYSYSFAPNPNWSKAFSPGNEIWDYLRDCAVRFGVMPQIKLATEVTEGHWEADSQRWRLETSAGTWFADVVVAGLGHLAEPAIPAIKGSENFKGRMFHSAQWDHEYDLTGKRVAVIGTGASAIQFVPQIQPQVGELHLFQRTPPWILPRNERRLTDVEHDLFRRFPALQKAIRAGIYTAYETRVLAFVYENRLLKVLEAVANTHRRRQVPDPELRAKLTPDYTIGCKRVLISNNYYPALSQPNVELVTDGIAELREHSVVTSDGSEREVDAIIWGTGFHVTDTHGPQRLQGEGDVRLSDVWGVSPQAYLGTNIPGFPNLFMMLGPNTGLGHSSMVYMAESQINYILSALKYMANNNVAAIDVRRDAFDSYNAELQSKVKDTVWNTGGCGSWYIDAEGRNTTLWPTFTFQFRRRTRNFDPAPYELEPRRAPAAVPVTGN